MSPSAMQVGAVVCLQTAVPADDLPALADSLETLNGVSRATPASDHKPQILIHFDAYEISGKEILKWLAQRAIFAELCPAGAQPDPDRRH